MISKGGTATIVNCVCIGMILSVSRYTEKLGQKTDVDPKTKDDKTSNEIGSVGPTSEALNNDSEFS
jgi:cell division protein FtsW